VKCDVCEGKGWKNWGGDGTDVSPHFPLKCWACTGTGQLTIGRIASLLYEPATTIRSVYRLRARPKTAKRVFDAVIRLLQPKKQKEMFDT
jgi:hypothetical protein